MLQDLGKTKEVNILNSLDIVIDPATNQKLDELKTLLQAIDANTDELELKADTINLNTDELESLIEEVRDTIGTETGNTVLSKLTDIVDKLHDLFISPGTGRVKVRGDNKVDPNNSTTETLGIDEYFLGDWTSVLDYSMLVVQVHSDVDSAIDGLIIEWSTDGTEVCDTDTFTVYSDGGNIYTFGCQSSYYRIRYTNGGAPQTEFDLSALLKAVNQKPSSHRVEDNISGQNDAELVKSVLTGKDPITGDYVNVRVTENGSLLAYNPPQTQYNTTIQLLWDKNHQAVNNYEWQELLSYTVPTGYVFSAISFGAESAVANEKARVVAKINHGSFDSPTDTYTDTGTAYQWELPKFGTRINVYVTSLIGSSNDTVTITYTNSLGVTGRTATVKIPKNSLAGTRREVLLQAGDIGVLDITNVTHTATGQAGTFDVYSLQELFYLSLTTSGQRYQAGALGLGGSVIKEGETVYLEYKANSAVNNQRRLSFVGTLILTTE